jgi:hypothetical protein
MRDEDTTIAALIAGYRACERPSPATKAQIVRALAEARRQPVRRATSQPWRTTSLPWVALAAALVLLFAWQAGPGRGAGRLAGDTAGLSSFAASKAREWTARSRARGVASPVPTRQIAEVPGSDTPPASAAHLPESDVQSAGAAHLPEIRVPSGSAERAGELAPAKEGTRRKFASHAAAPVATDTGSAVLDEMALLQRAREALRTHRPDEALALLKHHGEKFPRGALAEEREALRIAALCGAGELERGLAARATFMRTYQRSPYAARVLAACPAPPEDAKNVQSHE